MGVIVVGQFSQAGLGSQGTIGTENLARTLQ